MYDIKIAPLVVAVLAVAGCAEDHRGRNINSENERYRRQDAELRARLDESQVALREAQEAVNRQDQNSVERAARRAEQIRSSAQYADQLRRCEADRLPSNFSVTSDAAFAASVDSVYKHYHCFMHYHWNLAHGYERQGLSALALVERNHSMVWRYRGEVVAEAVVHQRNLYTTAEVWDAFYANSSNESIAGAILAVAGGFAGGYAAGMAARQATRPAPTASVPSIAPTPTPSAGTPQYRPQQAGATAAVPQQGITASRQQPAGTASPPVQQYQPQQAPVQQAAAPAVPRFTHFRTTDTDWQGRSVAAVSVRNEGTTALQCSVTMNYTENTTSGPRSGSSTTNIFVARGATGSANYPASNSGIGGSGIVPGSYNVQCLAR